MYSSRGAIKSSITYPSEDNLPEDVKTKLSVLKLMQDHDEVEWVGQKVSVRLYWIYDSDWEGVTISFAGSIADAIRKKQPLYELLTKENKHGFST